MYNDQRETRTSYLLFLRHSSWCLPFGFRTSPITVMGQRQYTHIYTLEHAREFLKANRMPYKGGRDQALYGHVQAELAKVEQVLQEMARSTQNAHTVITSLKAEIEKLRSNDATDEA